MASILNKLKKLSFEVKGASNLFGVTVNSAYLPPQNIYVRLSPSEEPLEGKVLIGRHPCNHPGDIQVVEAVDNPRLRHLHGVVVFPTTGIRPLADMLGGGDFDSDKFF